MKSNLLLVAIVSIATGSVSSLIAGVVYGQVNTPNDIPAFSIEDVATLYDRQTGEVVGHDRERQFFRADGSRAYVLRAGTPLEMRVIMNFAIGVRIEVRPASETISTIWLGPGAQEREQRKRQACGRDPAALRWTILGYEVVREERDNGSERWVAPALGCVALLATQRDREGNAHSVWRAENIRIGEPDPGWFRVPEGYVEMSPTDAAKLTAERLGLPPPPVP